MEPLLATSPWTGVILWILLYISDYYLTIYSARGFREVGHFKFEGSFELTPQYQKDIDALRPVSKLHILLLIAYSLIILLLWWLTVFVYYSPALYLLYLGIFIVLEMAVHMRHLRNIFLIREMRKSGGVEGEISYRKWFTYKMSAFELYLAFALFLIVAALTFSTFFLGGALACLGTGFKHTRLARKSRANPQQAVESQT